MKAFYSFLLLVAVAFTACDEAITKKLIQLADGTSTSLVFNADESGDATIKFTADAAWTASVSEVAASKSGESISWLKLSSYGGDAGENTITVSLLKNYTGASRKAEIKIVCGDSEVVITVEQKGESSAGTVAKRVNRIDYKEKMNSSRDCGWEPDEEEYALTFDYDADGMVARIVKNGKDKYSSIDTYTRTYDFDYHIMGKIRVDETLKYQSDDQADTYKYEVTLDNKGNAIELQENGDIVAKFGYTSDARLAEIKGYEYGIWQGTDVFTYADRLWSGYEYIDNDGSSEKLEFDLSSCYANKYPNNGMIDMMAYIGGGYDFDFLFYIGRLGKSSDYCLEKVPCFLGDDYISEHPSEYTEPNKLIETRNYKSAEYSDNDFNAVEYTHDDEGNITSIKQVEPYDVYEVTDEIWTSDRYEEREIYDHEKDELVKVKFYYLVTKRISSKFVKSGNDTYTYTISY